MMIPQITKALSEGFTTDQILEFLINKFPSIKDKVKQAKDYGFNSNQIVEFLQPKSAKREHPSQINTEYAEMRRKDIEEAETRSAYAQKAMIAAGSAAASPLLASALSRAIPSNVLPLLQQGLSSSNTPNTTESPTSQINVPFEQPPVTSANEPNIAQPAQIPQPKAISINPTNILDKFKSKQQVERLASTGNGAVEIGAYFRKFHPEIVKSLEKEAGQDIENVVESYLANKTKEPEIEPESKAALHEKGSTVVSPQGIGQILEVRNGQAIVDVDGKKHKVSEDELISSPLPEKELADLYDDLISGIEKTTGQQVSRNVDWAGYDPNTNELAYKPHGSDKLYAYEDISPEDVEMLTSLLTQRKSTGQNFIGAWEKGSTSPIGAAMYQLIQKLQRERGGKGNEYKNRYNTIYEALEPAKIAAKLRHEERKKKAKKPGIA